MNVKGEGKSTAFWSRPLLTVYIASFLILVNLMVSLTLFPVYVKYRGGSDFVIGLQSSIFTLASIVLRLYFGPLADSVGRKFPLLLGSFVFGTAPVFILLSPDFFVMSLARVYQAVGMATFLSAASSSVSELVPCEKQGTAIGLYRSSASAAILIGPFTGYRIINNFGYTQFFIFLSVTSLTAMIILFTVDFPKGAMQYSRKSVNLKDLFSLIRIKNLQSSYIGIILTSLASGIVLTFTAVYFETIPQTISPSLFFFIYAVFGILTSTFTGYLSDKFGKNILVFPLVLIFSFGLVILSRSGLGDSFIFCAAPALIAIGYSGGITNFATCIVDSAPDELRASALAFQESSIDIGNTIGIFIFGILASYCYYSPLLFFLGLIIFVFSFFIKLERSESVDTIAG